MAYNMGKSLKLKKNLSVVYQIFSMTNATLSCLNGMCGSRKICQGGSKFFVVFFMWGERIQITLKVGHHRPTSKMPFKWRFADGQIMAQH